MRKAKWILILLLVLVAAVYFGVPAFVGTSWARERIREAMAEQTKRDVKLGDLSFSWMSGLVVEDVVVDQRQAALRGEGPLFSLGSLNLNISLSDILDQKINVEKLSVEEPRFVIVRDPQGRFNFDDLLEAPSQPSPPSGGEAPSEPSGGEKPAPGGGGSDTAGVTARLDIEDGRLLFIDQALGTRVEADDLEAEVTWKEGALDVEMTFTLNGGATKLLASADLSRKPAPFNIKEFSIDEAALDAQLASVGMFMPLMGDKPQNVSGKMSFHLADVKGEGLDRASIQRTLSGAGDLKLEGGTVASGPIVQLRNALAALGAGDLSALSAGGASEDLAFKLVESTFAIADGKVKTDGLKLTGNALNLSLAGWTSLDGMLDYRLNLDGIGDLLARNEGLKKVLGGSTSIPFKLSGSLSDPKVTPDLEGTLKSAAESALKGALNDKLGDKAGGIADKLPGGLGGLLGGSKDKKKKDK